MAKKIAIVITIMLMTICGGCFHTKPIQKYFDNNHHKHVIIEIAVA